MRKRLCCAFLKQFSLGTVSVMLLNCGAVTLCGLQTVNMYLKVVLLQNGCIIRVLGHYFFALLVLYQKHLLLLLLAFSTLFSHLKKICLRHNLPQIPSKLYVCFAIKKLYLLQNNILCWYKPSAFHMVLWLYKKMYLSLRNHP